MAHHSHETHTETVDRLPTDTQGLPEATRAEVVELSDGDSFELEIAPVAKRIGDATVRMLAYNGSIPGPTLKIPQGATVTVPVTNRGVVRTGETVDILLDVTNPGTWMAHCHIAEHHESGMMFSFNVDEAS